MTVRLAMSFSEIDMADLDALIEDDNIALEQKVDGTRCMVVVRTNTEGKTSCQFLGRGGVELGHTAAMQHFSKIAAALKPLFTEEGETVIDGEIMIDTGVYVMFDLPFHRVRDYPFVVPTTEYRLRRQVLGALMAGAHSQVQLCRTEKYTREKRALLREVRESGGEGVMAKRLDSIYEPGKRVKTVVKVKFIKTADVVVTGSTRGRNAAGREIGGFSFAVYAPDMSSYESAELGPWVLTPLGSCSAIGKPEVKVGDVIEIAYLYRPPGGSPVQPRMIKVRPDKAPEDCTIDQFPVYSKAVL